jgi:FkbM family methyltransferase
MSILVERALRRSARSYSQAGEDMIARFALRELGILVPTYLDIGAHHPTWLSNTYYFYRHGCRGVCVEADPRLHRRIARRRRRDVCVNIAVGTAEGTATLHVMRSSTLSTLSPTSMTEYAALGRAHRRDVQVPMLTPATLLERHCPTVPNLVSLDIEGLDLDVLPGMGLRPLAARDLHRRDADARQLAQARAQARRSHRSHDVGRLLRLRGHAGQHDLRRPGGVGARLGTPPVARSRTGCARGCAAPGSAQRAAAS